MNDLNGYERYAVYWAPPQNSDLTRLATSWLGRDAESDEEIEVLELDELPEPREALVANACRYGFHATLKPPFSLAEGVDPDDLDAALEALAATRAAFDAPPLEFQSLDSFVCLGFSAPCPAMHELAALCVTGLDGLRAPLRPAQIARYRRAGLDTAQESHLRQWGYPYVLDRFRFHMTMSKPLPKAERGALIETLTLNFGRALEKPVRIDELCLFGDPGERGPFRLLKRYAMAG